VIWHLTFASEERHPLVPGVALQRVAIRTATRVAPEIFLFCFVDDHAHFVVMADAARVGRIAAALLLALRPLAAVELLPAHVRPVRSRSHLEWLAHNYILVQPTKHGLVAHAALHEGSCFLDLVDARVLPGTDPKFGMRLVEALPRYRMRRAYEAVGLDPEPLKPAPNDLLHQLGMARIAEAGAVAVAAAPGLAGNGAPEVLARRAATTLALEAGISPAECRFTFEVTRAAMYRWAREPVDHRVLKAIRMRLAIEVRVAGLSPRQAGVPRFSSLP
jgi:hypothetical protein